MNRKLGVDMENGMNELQKALRDIVLALNMTHNTIATDVVGLEPNDTSWRVDHSKELAQLDMVERTISSDTCPVCGGRSKCL